MRLRFEIEGLESESGNVTLGCFLHGLEHFEKALRRSTDLVAGDGAKAISFRVVELSHDSPASVTVQGFAKESSDEPLVASALTYLMNSLMKVRSGEANDVDGELKSVLKNLWAGIGTAAASIVIGRADTEISVDERLAETIVDSESFETVSWGSVCGHVERFNSHGQSRYFYLYSKLGDVVRCDFAQGLLERAVASVERNVTVTGKLRYKADQRGPYQCRVEHIDIHERDSELPELKVGAYPHMTGDVSTSEYLREIRDGWD